jgi:hypothetical protein
MLPALLARERWFDETEQHWKAEPAAIRMACAMRIDRSMPGRKGSSFLQEMGNSEVNGCLLF